MIERGNTTHGPRQDEELKHEAQPFVQGHGPSHVEEWRQTEPMPDDTDDVETVVASGIDGAERDATGTAVDPEAPGRTGAAEPTGAGGDTVVYSTETDGTGSEDEEVGS
jgi:hypothetical protein